MGARVELIAVGSQPHVVDRSILAASSVDVAPLLLNKLLVCADQIGRIVEVEAYGGVDDAASHAHRGRTERNSSMFARAGTLYCYLSHGIHTCANVVTGGAGEGQAVLVRAVEPVEGIEAMRPRRPAARRDVDLTNGPGKLCAALGIELSHDGLDLCSPRSPVWMADDGIAPPRRPQRSRRIGITKNPEPMWRWSIPGNPCVSRR